MIVPTIAFVLTTSLGLVFLASAVPKLRRPKSFVLVVIEYQALPERLVAPFARVLAVVELAVACLLLTGVLVLFADGVVVILLITFIVAIGVNVHRGRRIECGCFERRRPAGWSALLQDMALLTVATCTALASPGTSLIAVWSALRMLNPSSPLPALSLALCTAAAGWTLQRVRRNRQHIGPTTVLPNGKSDARHRQSARRSL